MRVSRRIVTALGASLFGIWPGPASAGKLDLITLGIELGRVLAAEQPCGLRYDQEAISAFIAKRVPADDLSFMSHVQTGIGATEFKLSEMTASQKTAL